MAAALRGCLQQRRQVKQVLTASIRHRRRRPPVPHLSRTANSFSALLLSFKHVFFLVCFSNLAGIVATLKYPALLFSLALVSLSRLVFSRSLARCGGLSVPALAIHARSASESEMRRESGARYFTALLLLRAYLLSPFSPAPLCCTSTSDRAPACALFFFLFFDGLRPLSFTLAPGTALCPPSFCTHKRHARTCTKIRRKRVLWDLVFQLASAFLQLRVRM